MELNHFEQSAGAVVMDIDSIIKNLQIDVPDFSYNPLWHLIEIEWLAGFRQTVGDKPIQSRVFLIDIGVHIEHPYLAATIDPNLAIDFSINPSGTAYSSQRPREFRIDPLLPKSLGLNEEHQRTIAPLIAKANGRTLKSPDRSAYHATFPGHGTACAGLIGARMPDQNKNAIAKGKSAPQAIIPYTGVDPLCTIVPILTSLNPTPDQLIMAFLYAVENEADVIHLPRGVATDWMNDNGEFDNPGKLLAKDQNRPLWLAFEALMYAVAREIPVVCAAGNSGESCLAYPASLSLEEKGESGIVSVGALSSDGYKSSYSNYGQGLSLVAPSDDAPVFNRHQIRINKQGRRYQFHDYEAYVKAGLAEVPLSRCAILTTDIPGRSGYAGIAPLGDDEDEVGAIVRDPLLGQFTLFGGTSAASSIVAGAASLLSRRAKMLGTKLSGTQCKRILMESASRDEKRLKRDDINGESPSSLVLFGAGLLNVFEAVNGIQNIADMTKK